ncbi:hypothetical protein EJ03DRAFT_328992 [Teratosphaeria nubilosa]|uniref:Uncharacterized protein n=1 Tax=Teratosphaeria nubilosa TaxID=161662 RepID=A0A6G1L3Z8_9PEZI|nr:hypothetical protein EJ03DRAFT_328992 [Teratosphaeria nubilosa]
MRFSLITSIALLSLHPSSLADAISCRTPGAPDCSIFGGKARDATCAQHPGHSNYYQCYPTMCDPTMAQGPPGKNCAYVGRFDRNEDNTHYKKYCCK